MCARSTIIAASTLGTNRATPRRQLLDCALSLVTATQSLFLRACRTAVPMTRKARAVKVPFARRASLHMTLHAQMPGIQNVWQWPLMQRAVRPCVDAPLSRNLFSHWEVAAAVKQRIRLDAKTRCVPIVYRAWSHRVLRSTGVKFVLRTPSPFCAKASATQSAALRTVAVGARL